MTLNELHSNYVKDPLGWEDEFSKEFLSFIRVQVIKNCRNPNQWDDIIGDVVVRVWPLIPQFDPTKSSFTTWVTMVVSRDIKDYFNIVSNQKEVALSEMT